MDIKRQFRATSTGVFVGRFNYPDVSMGIVSPPFTTANPESWDSPKVWSKEYSMEQVIRKRRLLINSSNAIDKKIKQYAQEIALSKRPIDVDIELKSKPAQWFKKDSITKPIGNRAKLKSLELCSNPSMSRVVEKCHYDTDLRSEDAVFALYRKGFDETKIMKMFSVGAFGLKRRRKIVPTRWSITATDDIIGRRLIESIKEYPLIEEPQTLEAELYGNHYDILLLPSTWGFELFETRDMQRFSHDYELYRGRKDYAKSTEGGYYASRLGVLEYLETIKRQATAIVLRKIDRKYNVPLGVWVVRQAVRKISPKEKEFSRAVLQKSVLFERFKKQRSIYNFM